MGAKNVGANSGRPITVAELPPMRPTPRTDDGRGPSPADLDRFLAVTTGHQTPSVKRTTNNPS